MAAAEQTGADPRLIGIAMLAGALLCALLALWIGWAATTRLLAVRAVNRGEIARWNGADQHRLREFFQQAAHHRPILGLGAIDANDPEASAQASRLASTVRSASERVRLELARELLALMHGQQPTALDRLHGLDGDLLRQMHELADPQGLGPLPPPPAVEGQAPQAALLLRWLEERLKVAWRLGHTTALREEAGRLLLYSPGHPAASELNLLVAALTPDELQDRHLQQAAGHLRDTTQRAAMLRSLIYLIAQVTSRPGGDPLQARADERLAQLVDAIPRDQRGEAENRIWLAANRQRPLSELITVVRNMGSPDLAAMIVDLAVQADDSQAFTTLLPALDPDLRHEAQLWWASRSWHTETRQALGEDSFRLRLLRFHRRADRLGLHLASDKGLTPTGTVEVSVNGSRLPHEAVLRHGSLIWIQVPAEQAQVELVITLAGLHLWSGSVSR